MRCGGELAVMDCQETFDRGMRRRQSITKEGVAQGDAIAGLQ
jgi:hypothetical protein